MNVNVLSKSRRLASITDFYCNKRVNILFRIKSFARRIRFHCKLHNQILYGNDNKLVEQNKFKLLNDTVDYFKTTQFIIEDLVVKSSFLSNHDSILILDILSRIKNPLEKISSKTNVSYFSEETNNNEHNNNNNIKYGTISRIISRGQTSLLKYLIRSEESMTLTNNERYYLIIALSRDCGLISFSTWMKLFENVYEALVTKPPESLYGHKPYEIANLLLIYDQISRWSYKRQNNKNDNSTNISNTKGGLNYNDNFNTSTTSNMDSSTTRGTNNNANSTPYGKVNETSEQIKNLDDLVNEYNYQITELKNDQLKVLDNELDLKRLERRTYNPFNLDIINVGIYRLEKCLEELKNEKIIKILYLANSRKCYSNNLFQNVLIYFESQGSLKLFELSEIYTLFNLFSKAYFYHLLRNIESLLYCNNLSIGDLEMKTLKQLNGYSIVNSINGIEYTSDNRDGRDKLGEKLDNMSGRENSNSNRDDNNQNGYMNNNNNSKSIDDELYKFNRLESMSLSIIIISLEYLRRISKIDKVSFLENESVRVIDRFKEVFGEDYEWKDILSLLENRITNNENIGKQDITKIKETIQKTKEVDQESKERQTHQEKNQRQLDEFIEKINTFRKINEYLLKLIDIDKRYENRGERIRFCMKLLDVIIEQATHSLTIDIYSSFKITQHNIAIEAIKTPNIDVQ